MKRCRRCGKELISGVTIYPSFLTHHYYYCKKCFAIYRHEHKDTRWEKRHPKEAALIRQKGYARKLRWLFKALGDKCADCGCTDPYILEIHHKNGYDGSHRRVLLNNSYETLKELLPELELLCPNCHAKRRMKNSQVRQLLEELIKSESPE